MTSGMKTYEKNLIIIFTIQIIFHVIRKAFVLLRDGLSHSDIYRKKHPEEQV